MTLYSSSIEKVKVKSSLMLLLKKQQGCVKVNEGKARKHLNVIYNQSQVTVSGKSNKEGYANFEKKKMGSATGGYEKEEMKLRYLFSDQSVDQS